VEVLLKRCLLDTDDEVRDRATFYLSVLRSGNSSIITEYILNTLKVSVVGLERALEGYLSQGDFDKSFDMRQVPLSSQPITTTEAKKPCLSAEAPTKKEEKPKASRQEIYSQKISAIPELAALGPLFKSSDGVELTESITEYNVILVKYIFDEHVLLQFECINTCNDQLLENVHVAVEPLEEETEWRVARVLPLASLRYSQPGTTYVLLKAPDGGQLSATFNATLKFVVKDVDPTTGEPESDEHYDDVYALETIEIGVTDYILPTPPKASFNTAWDQLTDKNEVDETYSLSTLNTLEDAVKSLTKCIGMSVCERSDKVPAGKSSHVLLLSGVFKGGVEVLSKVRLVLDPADQTVTMNIVVRSTDKAVSMLVASVIE